VQGGCQVTEAKVPQALRRTLQKYIDTRLAREKMEPLFKRLERDEDTYADRLHHLMEEFGMSSMRIDGIGLLVRSQKGPYCSLEEDEALEDGDVPESSRERFETWCVKEGLDDTLIKRVPIMTRVNSEVRARLKNGKELPPGLNPRWVYGVAWSDRPSDKANPNKARGK
jgi:hypothetical protein